MTLSGIPAEDAATVMLRRGDEPATEQGTCR
jgi:hypothetical protein